MRSQTTESVSPAKSRPPPSPRRNTESSLTRAGPTHSTSTSTPLPRSYLPFRFGFEAEVIIRPKNIANLEEGLSIPSPSAPARETRGFNLSLLRVVANCLSGAGMPAAVLDQSEDGDPDYSKWNVTLDASVSKMHIKDGFYPLEIVSPVIPADGNWVSTVNRFWTVLREHFEFRRDTSCGFHVHISFATGNYSLEQLRSMAKAIIFWEPATARCAPLSRQDQVISFCKGPMKDNSRMVWYLETSGPLRGLQPAFAYIDSADRNAIVDFVCPDKYRAWNFKPSRTDGHGSIEFRRPPGVVTAKKAKHWIAFAMTFLDMAIQFNPKSLADSLDDNLDGLDHPDFQEQFLSCAKSLGVYAQLDARLAQNDEPRSLYVSMMPPDKLRWLQDRDPDYGTIS